MARPPTEKYWVWKIQMLALHRPDLSGRDLRSALAKDSSDAPSRVPSVRTILNVKQRQTSRLDRGEQYFTWPEAMWTGKVPWEATPAALDLLRHMYEMRMEPPLIEDVQWFWRATQVAPQETLEDRLVLAEELKVMEEEPNGQKTD